MISHNERTKTQGPWPKSKTSSLRMVHRAYGSGNTNVHQLEWNRTVSTQTKHTSTKTTMSPKTVAPSQEPKERDDHGIMDADTQSVASN